MTNLSNPDDPRVIEALTRMRRRCCTAGHAAHERR